MPRWNHHVNEKNTTKFPTIHTVHLHYLPTVSISCRFRNRWKTFHGHHIRLSHGQRTIGPGQFQILEAHFLKSLCAGAILFLVFTTMMSSGAQDRRNHEKTKLTKMKERANVMVFDPIRVKNKRITFQTPSTPAHQ